MFDRIAIAAAFFTLGTMFAFVWRPVVVAERGYIGCQDGKMWAKNIDIDALTFEAPEGPWTVLHLDGRWCRDQGTGKAG